MILPDGTILMHGSQPYDPRKAHEYYIRNRKLKGRKKGRGEQPSPRQSSSKAAPPNKGREVEAFLKNLPMMKDHGASLEDAAKLVKWAAKNSDDEIKQAIKEYEQEGDTTGKVATLRSLMLMRSSNTKVAPAKKAATKKTSAPAKKTAKPKIEPKVAAKRLKAVNARVTSIRQELSDLNNKLKKAMAEARKTAAKEKRGPTASEKSKARRESKKYRDKNKQKIANKRKRASSSSKKSGSKKDSVADLKKKISEVQGRLDAAVKQQKSLSSAAKNG